MEQFISLLIALGLTACAYLLVPAILCIMQKDLTLSQIKKVVIANGIIVWFVFWFIGLWVGVEDVRFTPMLIWSGVAYTMLKRRCLYEPTPYVPKHKATRTTIVQDEPNPKTEKTYGNYNVYGRDLELVSDASPVVGQKEKPATGEKLSEERKQLINLALNVPEDKVHLALKLMHTITESE